MRTIEQINKDIELLRQEIRWAMADQDADVDLLYEDLDDLLQERNNLVTMNFQLKNAHVMEV